MNKKLTSLLALVAAAGLLAAAPAPLMADQAEPQVISLAGPPAPPTLPMLRLVDAQPLATEGVTFKYTPWQDAETLMAMIASGDQQFFALPLTISAKLYNKGVPLQLMNVNTWGVTYLISSDKNMKSLADLKGKTLSVPLQSSPPDAFTQYFLKKEGLTLGVDVQLQYFSPLEVGNLAAAGQTEYAVVLEPHVTKALTKNKNMRVVFSFDELWKKHVNADSNIATAGFGGRAPFMAKHPELTAKIQAAYKDAVEWVNANPAQAGALMEKTLGLKAQLVAKAIPNMGLEFKSALDAKDQLADLYKLLLDFNGKLIGGKIPDDGFFYKGQ